MLERNAGLFRTPAKIERVRFPSVPDAVVRALELRKGTADIERDRCRRTWSPSLERDPDFAVDRRPGTKYAYSLSMSTIRSLAHREVRQALAFATDRGTIIRYLLHGEARSRRRAAAEHWAYEPDVTQYPYDPRAPSDCWTLRDFRAGPIKGGCACIWC